MLGAGCGAAGTSGGEATAETEDGTAGESGGASTGGSFETESSSTVSDSGTETDPGDSSGSTGTDTSDDAVDPFRLPQGHTVPRKVDPVLVHPRPDAETPAWAKHRRHHPGVDYRIPIGVGFGSWPFYFEAVSLPSGCTVGSFLSEDSGNRWVVGSDYGVVTCSAPTEGLYDMHVRVHFQDDHEPLDVEWTLEVTPNGTIVVDPLRGDDATGDGSLASPFRTANAWWRNDLADTTYRGYQVLYRGGTHNVAVDNTQTGVSEGNWRLGSDDKPLVHYGYPGEEVVFDMSETTISATGQGALGEHPSGSDMFFGNIVFANGPSSRDNPRMFSMFDGTSGPREYADDAGGARSTWFDNTFRDFECTTTASNNAGVLWAPNPGEDDWRHFMLVSRNRFERVNTQVCNVNWNGFYVAKPYNILEEHTHSEDTRFGKGTVTPKSSGMFMCFRNLDHSDSPEMLFEANIAGSYDPTAGGPYELSYSRIRRVSPAAPGVAVFHNSSQASFDPRLSHSPIYQFRNSLSRAPVADRGAIRIGGDGGGWPVELEGDLLVSDEPFYLDNQPINAADEGAFTQFDVASDPLGESMRLSDNAELLGRYGADVAGDVSQ